MPLAVARLLEPVRANLAYLQAQAQNSGGTGGGG